jgi:hypothetical protein
MKVHVLTMAMHSDDDACPDRPTTDDIRCSICGASPDSGRHDTRETCEDMRGPCLDPASHHPFRPVTTDNTRPLGASEKLDAIEARYAAEVAASNARIAALRATLQRQNDCDHSECIDREDALVKTILAAPEWVGWDIVFCYWCGNDYSQGHTPDCLRVTLSRGPYGY